MQSSTAPPLLNYDTEKRMQNGLCYWQLILTFLKSMHFNSN